MGVSTPSRPYIHPSPRSPTVPAEIHVGRLGSGGYTQSDVNRGLTYPSENLRSDQGRTFCLVKSPETLPHIQDVHGVRVIAPRGEMSYVWAAALDRRSYFDSNYYHKYIINKATADENHHRNLRGGTRSNNGQSRRMP